MKIKKKVVYCDARKRDGSGPCRREAGWGTHHPGVGRCKRHGGSASKNLVDGRYSKLKHRRVYEALNMLAEVEINALDLLPEAQLLRALTINYVEDYEAFVEALMTWYADPETTVKPRRIMDISDASGMIEAISRVVERIHKIQSTGAISLATFSRVTEQMGVIVARHVKDDELLRKIEVDWGMLALDAKVPEAVPAEEESNDEEDE